MTAGGRWDLVHEGVDVVVAVELGLDEAIPSPRHPPPPTPPGREGGEGPEKGRKTGIEGGWGRDWLSTALP